MTEAYIEVTGTNQRATQDTDAKKLETTELVNGDGKTVHREGVFIGDPLDVDAKAQVSNTNPNLTDYGLVTRPIMPQSQFGEALTTKRTPIIQLNSVYGINTPLRDAVEVTETGTGTSAATGEILLQTGSNADGAYTLESAEIGRYIPGYGAEFGIGIRYPFTPTGTQTAKWGGETADGNNAFIFGHDADTLYVARIQGGVELNRADKADWNIDPLDGTGASGYTLDETVGIIYQIRYTWYGYGQIIFGILGVVGQQQTFIPVHQISNKDFIGTSINDPSLRVFATVDNGGTTASNFQLYVGGRQYSIIGDYRPKFRFTGHIRSQRTVGDGVMTPLVSFRFKSAFNGRSVKIDGYDMINVGSNNPVYIEVRLNGTLTGPSWATPNNYTAADTALEADSTATAITGGNVVWAGDIIPAGDKKQSAANEKFIDLDLPRNGTFTLCAAGFGGTSEIISGFRMNEEW